jgi:HK97 gp10 family phage protein
VAASAGNAVTWKVIYNHLPQIAKGMENRAAQIVAKTALDIEAGAKVRAPVDTGTLRASIQARRISPTHWIVTVGVDYGIYLEYGTRFMGARPYFGPAIRAVRSSFNQAMKGVVK